jgi:hypothetical protein
LRGKTSHPIYMKGYSRLKAIPIETKNTFLLSFVFSSFYLFPDFSNPNICSSTVIEGILAGLLMLGQPDTRSP